MHSTAGFFLWIDLSKCLDSAVVTSEGGWAAEQDLSHRLRQIGVEMSSGYAYHNELPGWYRVIFAVDSESLKEGLSRYVSIFYVSKEYTLKKTGSSSSITARMRCILIKM